MTLTSSLTEAFTCGKYGLCGRHEGARIVLEIGGLEQRLNVLALGVVMDTKFLSAERWSILTALGGHWILDPSQVAFQTSQQVWTVMQGLDLRAPQYIARVWWQICRGVQGRSKGSWRALFRVNNDDAVLMQRYLNDHRATFPVLAGPSMSARWLDLVHRLGGIPLQNWETLRVKLPAVQGRRSRLFNVDTDLVHPLFASALHSWSKSCKGQGEESCGFRDCPRWN